MSIYPASRSRVGWVLHDIPISFKLRKACAPTLKGRDARLDPLVFTSGAAALGSTLVPDLQRFQQPRA